MDRYKNVENQKPELPNGIEIRISSHAPLDNYLRYATNLLQRGPKEIVLKAMGQAMCNAVIIAENLKRDIPRLYQDTAISSVSTIDETIGDCTRRLDVARTRSVAMISITLSTEKLNVNSPGYQDPSNVDQSKQQCNYQSQQQHPLGQEEVVDNMGNGDNYVRGRGCGKFRGSYAAYRASSSYANNNRGGSSANNRVSGYAGVGYGRGGFARGRSYVGRGGGRMGRFFTLKSSESSMCDEDGEIIDIDNPSTSTTQSGTTLRSIFCLKNKDRIKEIEEREDCFILDFDPSDELNIVNLSIGDDTESDLCIVAEKGQVACRDYPHPRNSCAKFPFANTPHESYCGQCYCFVCDLVAPCENWTGIYGHCHAYSNEIWNKAKEAKKGNFLTL